MRSCAFGRVCTYPGRARRVLTSAADIADRVDRGGLAIVGLRRGLHKRELLGADFEQKHGMRIGCCIVRGQADIVVANTRGNDGAVARGRRNVGENDSGNEWRAQKQKPGEKQRVRERK